MSVHMLMCSSDVANRRLYWVDSKLHLIASVDLNGAHRRMHMLSAEMLGHPYALAVFEVRAQPLSRARHPLSQISSHLLSQPAAWLEVGVIAVKFT